MEVETESDQVQWSSGCCSVVEHFKRSLTDILSIIYAYPYRRLVSPQPPASVSVGAGSFADVSTQTQAVESHVLTWTSKLLAKDGTSAKDDVKTSCGGSDTGKRNVFLYRSILSWWYFPAIHLPILAT